MAARKSKRAIRSQPRARKATKRPARAARAKRAPKRRGSAPGRSRRTAVARPRRPASKPPSTRRSTEPSSPPPVPNDIGLRQQHMDYTSQDLESIRRFYVGALGFRDFVHEPQVDYLTVRTGSSSSLGFMPPMPGPPEEWRPPREPAIYLIVADVDRAYRKLLDRSVAFDQPPTDMPWGHRIALLRDPEGRRVCLAQILHP